MRSHLSSWAPLWLGAVLLGLPCCGGPDLIITAAGFPAETRWLDVILLQLSGSTTKQQSTGSRQLIDVSAKGDATFYKIGLKNLDRMPTYALFVAAFKDDGMGTPCLLNTGQALQDPGWLLVGDILVPFYMETEYPKTSCLKPQNAAASWPTATPFIASVSLATTTFDGQAPADIPLLTIQGWNFMLDDTVSVLFDMPPQTPTVKSRVINPELIGWSVEQPTSGRLKVQDMIVERSDKSARHTVTLNVDIPN